MQGKWLLAASALLMSSAAHAQMAEEDAFSGPYIGVSGGYDIQGNDVGSAFGFDRNGDGTTQDPVLTSTGADAFSPGYCDGRARGATPGATCENDRNKPSYYGRVGFDVRRGPLVVGLLGEFGRSDIRDYVTAFSTTPASYTFERGLDWEASVRLRAGYTVNKGLFYVTGGGGYARIDHKFTTTNTANSFSTLVDDRDRKGFIVGGGVEYHILDNVTFGTEYTYHDYKDRDYKIFVGRGTAAATNPFVLAPFTNGTTLSRADNNFRWHSLRATLNFRF